MISNRNKNTQRNITPNFLKFKRKSSKGSKEEEGLESHNTDRSNSKAGRCSFEVCEKRVLHLNKLKNNLNLKIKETSVEPIKKRREGLQVTSRRNSTKKEENEQQVRTTLNTTKKTSTNNSSKAIKLGNHSRQKSARTSAVKRSEQSIQKEQLRAKQQNKDLINTLMQQQFAPNYINKLKVKRLQQKEARQAKPKTHTMRKFLNVDIEIKSAEELNNYQIYTQLGKGAYGVVKMGINKENNQKVAIKIYEKRKLDEPNKIKNLQRQINILAKLNHPVIARLIDAIETNTQIFLIQEYGGANSLYNYLLSKPQHRLAQSQAKQFFKTITETIQYLHQRNIVHRDIKAQNILLNRNKQLKLIDFGFSLESEPPNNIDTFCGTPTYMAPEIVSKKDHIPIYTDLWSLGVFLFVILQGNYPFRAKNENDLFEKIRKGQFEYIHKDISERSRYVIERLMRVNPMERMTTDEMTQSFWDWFLSQQSKPFPVQSTIATNITTYSN